jgi:hypothetical protein
MEKSKFWHSVAAAKRKLQFLKAAVGIERKHPLELPGSVKVPIVELLEVGKVVSAVALSVGGRERCIKYKSPERGREDIEVDVSL